MDNQYLQCTIFTASGEFLAGGVIGRPPGQPIDMVDVCDSFQMVVRKELEIFGNHTVNRGTHLSPNSKIQLVC